MLITKEPGAEKKTQFRIRMNNTTYDEITAYCQWAGIRFKDYFIEQACRYIFSNDEQWKKFKEHEDNKE